MSLDGQVAIITGAGSDGQGRATAKLFAEAGAKIVVTDINEPGVEETAAMVNAAHRGSTVAVIADVAEATQVRSVVDTAISRFGRLDCLINNAGIVLWKTIDDTSEEEWDHVVDVDLKSVFLFSKYAIPHMRKVGGGSIVNISSFSGLAGQKRHVAYCAAKTGVVAVTKCLALDHGPENIRTNCICPGAIATDMLRLGVNFDEAEGRARLEGHIPLRRVASSEEVASVSLFLCSKAASYINGAILPVDGGISAGVARTG